MVAFFIQLLICVNIIRFKNKFERKLVLNQTGWFSFKMCTELGYGYAGMAYPAVVLLIILFNNIALKGSHVFPIQ